MKNKKLQGFTLIELLIVIGIIAILAGIVLVAVNPAQQFGKANDSERKSEIGTILSAVYHFGTTPTNRGALPECFVVGDADPTAADPIPVCDGDEDGSDGAFVPTDATAYDSAIQLGTANGNYDCSDVLPPAYIREIPVDPNNTLDATNTGYFICRSGDAVDVIYILAPYAEVFNTAADGGCRVPVTSPNHADVDPDAYAMCVSA